MIYFMYFSIFSIYSIKVVKHKMGIFGITFEGWNKNGKNPITAVLFVSRVDNIMLQLFVSRGAVLQWSFQIRQLRTITNRFGFRNFTVKHKCIGAFVWWPANFAVQNNSFASHWTSSLAICTQIVTRSKNRLLNVFVRNSN